MKQPSCEAGLVAVTADRRNVTGYGTRAAHFTSKNRTWQRHLFCLGPKTVNCFSPKTANASDDMLCQLWMTLIIGKVLFYLFGSVTDRCVGLCGHYSLPWRCLHPGKKKGVIINTLEFLSPLGVTADSRHQLRWELCLLNISVRLLTVDYLCHLERKCLATPTFPPPSHVRVFPQQPRPPANPYSQGNPKCWSGQTGLERVMWCF